MKKLLTTISILFIATAGYAQTYTVSQIIDCNTLKLTSGEEVRLIGIKCPKGWKMRQEAKELVKGLFEGRRIELEYDVQKRDKYDRLLAYAYRQPLVGAEFIYSTERFTVKRNDRDYWFINALIIDWGYAQPMTIPPNVKYAQLFEELYKEAREQGRGLWKEKVPYEPYYIETNYDINRTDSKSILKK